MAGEFCPRCGGTRSGAFRFCRQCGFDFEATPELQPPDRRPPAPPVATAQAKPSWPEPAHSYSEKYAAVPTQSVTPTPPAPRGRGRSPIAIVGGLLIVGVVAAVLLANAGGKPSAAAVPTGTPGTDATPTMTFSVNEPTPPLDTPTPEASVGLLPASLGAAVSMECAGEPCMDVTVDEVKFASSYKDPQGFYNDTPKTKGDVFMAVHVTYKATGPNASYNEWDWGAYVNDVAVPNFAIVMHGPTPELSAGDLPAGKSAAGWIVFEVPASGKATIIYQPGRNSIFEVTLRAS